MSKPVEFKSEALQDFFAWHNENKQIFKKIFELITDIQRHPFEGIGKPEPLKHQFSGCWSRRLNLEHRLVYRISEERIEIISCRFHY
jgi:toxin YoeB